MLLITLTSSTLENTELVDPRQSRFYKQVNFHLFQRYVLSLHSPVER